MYATVILDKSIDTPLEYAIPDDLIEKIEAGSRVIVPLRGSPVAGTVLVKHKEKLFDVVHPIQEIAPGERLFSQELFQLADWISKYYGAPLRKTMLCMIPSVMRKNIQPLAKKKISFAVSSPKIKTYIEENRHRFAKQTEILDILSSNQGEMDLSLLLSEAKTTKAPIQTLIKKGILTQKDCEVDLLPIEEEEFFQQEKKVLSIEQSIAFSEIVKTIHQGSFKTHLLFGVTGSGKTEVYLQAMQEARNLGKDVILLVPEIALTSQTIERIKSRFPEKIAVLHHRLSQRERFSNWNKIRQGEIHIVIGARSAIFSPLSNLGLIIVDEEQENSYKQMEDIPCYHARDIAIVRGKFANATVVLGSATPSIETFYNAKNGKFALHTLKERPKGSKQPKVTIVDMQTEREKANGFSMFSTPLLNGIESRVKKGEQVILFLNRRGYFSCQKCEHCEEVIRCKNCDVTLTFHKEDAYLCCHLCGYTLSPPPSICPSCHKEAAFKYKGPGTEQVERSLHKIFPNIRTLRMDRDTTKKKQGHDVIFKEFRAGKADVLIGTQMIAKGLHFPSVTLVGVLNADSGLMIPDFRSQETSFQILTQVAGRSGRSFLEGEVIFQTSFPTHSIIQYAAKEDYLNFFEEELSSRELLHFPPFTQMVKIIVSGKYETKVKQEIDRLYQECKPILPSSYLIYPPIPCGHPKINNKFRFQFFIKGPKGILLPTKIGNLLQTRKRQKDAQILLDVDPLNTFF
jgi:primosomal protein N' (replication factor Y)